MKVLVIGNWRENSGWSQGCRNLILSLDTIPDVEVVPRNINILNNQGEIPERIKELESRSDKNPDVIIQAVLPNMLERNNRIKKNIAFCMFESSNFINSGWAKRINMMQTLVVPCWYNKQAALKSNVEIDTQVVPLATDIKKYSQTYPVHRIREVFKEDYIFYAVGEWTTRKNMEAIVKAFALEFHRDEPVELFIKTNPGVDINRKLEDCKNELRIYGDMRNYRKEIVLAEFTNEESINSIHQSADCYISSSHGEAWNIPAMDALGFGKSVIAPRYGGFLEYLNDKNSWLVDGISDNIWRAPDSGYPDIYTSDEEWFYPSISSLRANMRSAYSKRDLAKKKSQQGKIDINKFSFENVSKIFQKVLLQ